jgi:hypothetical protein
MLQNHFFQMLPPARVAPAGPARGWSTTSTSTSVPDDILALFLGGAAAAAAVDVFELPAALGFVLGFSVWPFRFLISGIIFDGSMSAN